jgi:ADP-heptose:LPS heptosyltransferase
MRQFRKPYPIPDPVKEAAYRGIRLGERVVRGVSGGNPRLDATALRGIRTFLLPQFQASLGCTVHSTPIVEALHQAVPGAYIVGAMTGIALDVFRHHPGLARLEVVPDPTGNFPGATRELRRIVASFNSEPYCVVLTSGDENVRASVALAAMLSGNGVRAGMNVAWPLLHLRVGRDWKLSIIANNLRLLELLGHRDPGALEPRVYFTAGDLEHVRALISGGEDHPLAVLITRTSGGQPTRWPDDRFVAVAVDLMRRGFRIVLPGTKADVVDLAGLARRMGPRAISLAGQTTIPQLAALCAASDLAVTVDTGAMHVARAQGVPLAIVAPAWQKSVEWMPLGKPWARILKGPWFPPPPPPGYAIEEVSVDEVIAAVDDLLHVDPPSPAAREARIGRSLEGVNFVATRVAVS